MVICTARASASPPSPWTARSGQPRAAAATWLTHSGTTHSLTAWLLVIYCGTTGVCVCLCVRVCACFCPLQVLWAFPHVASFCHPPCMTADASKCLTLTNTSQAPSLYTHTHLQTHFFLTLFAQKRQVWVSLHLKGVSLFLHVHVAKEWQHIVQ